MKKALLLFLTLLPFFSYAGSSDCPRELEVNTVLSSCSDVCNRISTKVKPFSYRIPIGPNSFGPASSQSAPAFCSCIFYNKDENEITDYMYCNYSVEITKGSSNLREQPFQVDSDYPSKLVELFSFNASSINNSSVGSNVIMSGLYKVYVSAVKNITTTFALMLVIIVTGWNLGLYVLSNFIDKMRGSHSELQTLISSDFKKKSMQVLPAVIIFGLPVPVSTNAILQGSGVSVSNTLIRENFCSVYDQQIADLNKTASDIDNSKNQAMGDMVVLDSTTNTGELINSSDEFQSRVQVESEEINRKIRVLEQMKADCESRVSGVSAQSNIVNSFLASDVNDVWLPIITAVIKNFVAFGLSSAKTVSALTSGIVTEYVSASIVTNRLEGANRVEQSAEIVRLNREVTLKSRIENIPSECGEIKSCSDYWKFSDKDKLEKESSYPHCSIFYENLSLLCDPKKGYMAYYDSVREKILNNQAQIMNSRNMEENIRNALNSSLGQVKAKFTWLSPALIPLSSVYAEMMYLTGNTDVSERTRIKFVGGSSTLLESAGDALANSYDTLRGFGEDIKENVEDAGNIMFGEFSLNRVINGDDNYGRMFVIGQMVGVTSLPPGSLIKKGVEGILPPNLNSEGDSLQRKIVSLLNKSPWATVASYLYKFTSSIVAIIVSYSISMMILKLIPLLAIVFPVVFRFIAYLKDVIKIVLVVPFYAVAAATKQPGVSLEVGKDIVRLTMTPVVIAFVPLVGFAAVELVQFFLYEVPIRFVQMAVVYGTNASHVAMFVMGIFSAALYSIAMFASAIVGWEVTTSFIDGVFEIANKLAGSVSSSTARAVQSAAATLRPRMMNM